MPINTAPHIHHLIICANIFVRKDGKYLLLKRSAHKRYAPSVVHPIGGKVDGDENPYTAAQREVLEEAGITVKNMRLEAVVLEIKPAKDESENWLIFHFSADYDSGKLASTEEGEFVLLHPEDILKQNLFPSVREIIPHILNPHDGTVFLTTTYDENENIITTSIVKDVCVV